MKGTSTVSGFLTLALFFIFLSKGYSIGDQTQIGAREVSLGAATVAMISPFSVFYNQASVARFDRISFAIDYRQPYLISDLSEKALAVVIPTAVSNFAFSLLQRGIPGYSESKFGLTMAKGLGRRIYAGLQFNYFLIGFPEQGSKRGAFLIEFGILFQTSSKLSMGVHIFNPSRASIESLSYKTDLPSGATAGIAVTPSSTILFVSSITYYNGNPLNIRLGMEYQVANRFFIRGGVSGKPILHAAGIGYKSDYFGVDFAFVHHETLGYTPSVSLVLNL